MNKRFLRAAALLAAFALGGCSREVAPEPEPEVRLGEQTDVDVAAWLKLPRPELAKLSDEWAAVVKHDLEAYRKAPDAVELLPKLYPPVRVPIFREAAFSAPEGFSLPPYVKEGGRDSAVALHLARYGDTEAALRLAPSADMELHRRIHALHYEKDYPLEWSRLVGFVLASSQLKLASGNVEAATRLVRVHQQLRSVLDPKAAAGPLGSVLLPTGRRALLLAATAWRDPNQNKPLLADDVEKAVTEWGPVPEPKLGLAPGATKDDVAGAFGKPVVGKAVTLTNPADMVRPLDLMALPIPSDALAVLGVFLDDKDRLAEIQLTYRAKIEEIYPEPTHLAFHLDEHGMKVKNQERGASLYFQTFLGAGLVFEATRTNRSNALGGWVRVTGADRPEKTAVSRSLRDFGPVHLDRGFEANRVALAPAFAGPTAIVTDRAALVRLIPGLDLPVPASAALQREPDYDLLASLRLTWNVEQNTKAISGLLPALWSAFGNPKVVATDDQTGAYLGFTWQDEQTRVQLRMPFDEKGPMLVVEDLHGKDALAQRAEEAHRLDLADRKVRLEANKADVRLLRSPGLVNDFTLEGLRLGQSKAEAEAALPHGPRYRRKNFPGGVSVLVLTTPTRGAPFWARQIILRYDAADKLAEVRLRYQEGLAKAKKEETLLAALNDGKAGAPESSPAAWTALWSDLPRSRAKPVLMRWMDDATICTYQKDAGGSEVTWTDRGKENAVLPPLAFVKSGVVGCKLGNTKEAVQAALKAPVGTSRGADVYRQPSSSPYEMALVWYKDGKVSRILAVHRDRPADDDRSVIPTLGKVWGRDIDELGFIRRQEGQRGQVAGSYFWHDDRTRVESFVQSTDKGPRLMTDFRPWSPADVKAAPPATADATKKPGDQPS